MDCEQVASLLNAYLDDELTDELRAGVVGHLLRCRQCAWEAVSLQEIVAALRTAALPTEPREEFRERLLGRLLRDHRAAVAQTAEPSTHGWRPRVPFILDLAEKEE
jgi:anti-sigma factor RsiW